MRMVQENDYTSKVLRGLNKKAAESLGHTRQEMISQCKKSSWTRESVTTWKEGKVGIA